MLQGDGEGQRSNVSPLAGVVSQNQSKMRRSSSAMRGGSAAGDDAARGAAGCGHAPRGSIAPAIVAADASSSRRRYASIVTFLERESDRELELARGQDDAPVRMALVEVRVARRARPRVVPVPVVPVEDVQHVRADAQRSLVGEQELLLQREVELAEYVRVELVEHAIVEAREAILPVLGQPRGERELGRAIEAPREVVEPCRDESMLVH